MGAVLHVYYQKFSAHSAGTHKSRATQRVVVFVQVGTQLFAPAAILIAAGLMLVQAAFISESGPAGEWAKDDIRTVKIPVAFYQTLGSFFGWWTSSCWALVCGLTLVAFGTGVVQEGGTEKKPQ